MAGYSNDPLVGLSASAEQLNREQGLDGFTPFSIDVTPLQKLLINLAQQVEKLQADNQCLREELEAVKIDKRLEALETGLQELAENTKPAQQTYSSSGTGVPSAQFSAAGQDGINGPGADSSWVVAEFTAVKDRLAALERRSEALWHSREGDEELRLLVGRLKTDVEGVQTGLSEAQTANKNVNQATNRLDVMTNQTRDILSDLTEKLTKLDAEEKRAAVERQETTGKLEAHVNSIWDQIRHVENSLSQRLTLAETSQVSTLQEVDEQKEAANELLVKVEDGKRHIAALESKLDSFNTQVAAAISPLHTSLGNVQVRLEELASSKQDADKALTLADVNAAAARAVDHADRRADNIIKSIGAMEERIEALDEAKAALADVVLSVDLEALLATHAQQVEGQLSRQRDDIMKAMGLKADREEVVSLEARQGARLGVLEAAILKGLRAISDKVAAALAEKLDLSQFSEFKVQVRAILSDVEDRLRDWSPAARGMKAPLDGSGAQGATSCLCCDSRVRSVRDLHAMGFTAADKVLSPERLPVTEPLLPAINRSPEVASSVNAKLLARKKDTAALLQSLGSPTRKHDTAIGLQSNAQPNMQNLDPMILSTTTITVPAGAQGAPIKAEVETISAAIGAGRIPDTRNPGRQPGKLSKQANQASSGGTSPWQGASPATTIAVANDLAIDLRGDDRAQVVGPA